MSVLSVIISSPEKIIWAGKADSVTSENSQGSFDILSKHANFVTILEKKTIFIHHGNTKEKFLFETAVLSVRSDIVTIYVDL